MPSWRDNEFVDEPDKSDKASAPNVGHFRRYNEISQVDQDNRRDLDQIMKEIQELKRT